MNLTKYFQYNPELDLTVAQIGMSKWNWQTISHTNSKRARDIMFSEQFDILPIVHNGGVHSYFKTCKYGDYSSVELLEIQKEDLIYYRLSFFDLLRRMQKDQRVYYFLTDSSDILGFINLPQLNCLAVYNYLYQVIANLERKMIEYIKSISNEDEVIEILKNSKDNNAADSVKKYEELKKKNLNNSIFEHIYFSSLNTILKRISKKHKINKEVSNLRKHFSPNQRLTNLRNKVAHPVRSIFNSPESINEVNDVIQTCNKLISILSIDRVNEIN